jgi:tetratricopeptide (TPR) repeat protein
VKGMQSMTTAGQGTSRSRTPKVIEGKVRTMADPAQQRTMQEYANALQWMQEGRYEKAQSAFSRIMQGGTPELVDRARVHLAACERQIEQDSRDFRTPEERYDYAISLLNTGYFEEAREQFEQVLHEFPEADYALYGLAILESMTGLAESCLEHLQQAIHLNARNRIQARTDPDFQDMADDPRFTELLYPEIA